MAHYSHGNWSGIGLTIGKRGIVFTKPANSFNRCMRRELLGKGGGGRAGQMERFTNAAKAC